MFVFFKVAVQCIKHIIFLPLEWEHIVSTALVQFVKELKKSKVPYVRGAVKILISELKKIWKRGKENDENATHTEEEMDQE